MCYTSQLLGVFGAAKCSFEHFTKNVVAARYTVAPRRAPFARNAVHGPCVCANVFMYAEARLVSNGKGIRRATEIQARQACLHAA